MAIKRIKFYNMESKSAYVGLANLNFYDINDNRIQIGITLSTLLTNSTMDSTKKVYTCATTNYGQVTVNVTCNYSTSSTENYLKYSAIGPFCDDADTESAASAYNARRVFLSNIQKSNVYYEVIFEKPIDFAYMSWTSWGYTSSSSYVNITSPYAVEIEDESGAIAYQKTDINPSKCIFAKSYAYLDTEEKSYITNNPQRIFTTSTSRIDSINLINGIRVKHYEPENTKIRYALSFGGSAYRVYNKATETWDNLTDNSAQTVIDNGMSKADIEDVLSVDFYKTNGHVKGQPIDVLVSMITSDSKVTPRIIQFKVLGYKEQ